MTLSVVRAGARGFGSWFALLAPRPRCARASPAGTAPDAVRPALALSVRLGRLKVRILVEYQPNGQPGSWWLPCRPFGRGERIRTLLRLRSPQRRWLPTGFPSGERSGRRASSACPTCAPSSTRRSESLPESAHRPTGDTCVSPAWSLDILQSLSEVWPPLQYERS